jgi:hypothetical protein
MRGPRDSRSRPASANPLQLFAALQMAAVALGLTDVDALTVSMARAAATASIVLIM